MKEILSQDSIIQEDFHRTNIKRVVHTLCLLIPIAAAFGGYWLSTPLGKAFFFSKDTIIPEYFKFICTLICFAIPTVIIFIVSRKESTIMKIRIFKNITNRT